MAIQEKTIKKTLAFMLEYQQLVKAKEDFGVTKLINKHNAPTSVPSVMKELGYISYKLINRYNITNRTVMLRPFTEEDATEVLKVLSQKAVDRKKNKPKKVKSMEITPAKAIANIHVGDIQKVYEFLIEFKDKEPLDRAELIELIANHNLPDCTLEQLNGCAYLTAREDFIKGYVYTFKHAVVETHMARKLLTAILRVDPSFSFSVKKDTTEDIVINKVEVIQDSNGDLGYGKPEPIEEIVEETERKFSVEQAKAFYILMPGIRDSELKDYTDEELGIDSFPKTWKEVETKLEELTIDCYTTDPNTYYIDEAHANQADATNKLQWIAYYLNSKREKGGVVHYTYSKEGSLRTTSSTIKLISNEIIFFSLDDLKRALVEYKDLWNQYFRI